VPPGRIERGVDATVAFAATFLTGADRAMQVRQLVAFLNSIDDATPTIASMRGTLAFDPDLCPVTFP